MKKKRPKRKASKPPPRRRADPSRANRRTGTRRAAAAHGPFSLQYKVVELSTVDEGALERCLNEWTAKGYQLDGVQFAMRESSKRPAMAFVFFTREALAHEVDEAAAREKLRRLSEGQSLPASAPELSVPLRRVSAHERLAQLAGLDEPEAREEGLTLEPPEELND